MKTYCDIGLPVIVAEYFAKNKSKNFQDLYENHRIFLIQNETETSVRSIKLLESDLLKSPSQSQHIEYIKIILRAFKGAAFNIIFKSYVIRLMNP